MGLDYLIREYGQLTVDDDPEWAGGAIAPGGFAFKIMEPALDALLDKLEERRIEWRNAALDLAAFPTINFPMFNELPERLIAALRADSGKETER